MNINLEYYKLFYYVAQNKSITAAAEKLCVSQPAVSQGIKQLEVQLATHLFKRNSKGVLLTPEGEELYRHIKPGYEKILYGESLIKRMNELEHGEIRIGASDMTLRYYLLEYLETFHERYPKVKVSVTNGPTPETLNYLKDGNIDFGIVSSPFFYGQDLNVIPVKQIQDIFIAGKKFESLKDKKLQYKELEELSLICLEKNTSTRKYIDEYLLKNNVIIKPEFELATSDMIVQFAIRNLGVGQVVDRFAYDYIRSGCIFRLEFEDNIPERDICIVHSVKNPISKAAAKLIEMLK